MLLRDWTNTSKQSMQYSRLGGEISTLRDQLDMLQKDLDDFKNIDKRYTDQLVKVKVSGAEACGLKWRSLRSNRWQIWPTATSRSTRKRLTREFGRAIRRDIAQR